MCNSSKQFSVQLQHCCFYYFSSFQTYFLAQSTTTHSHQLIILQTCREVVHTKSKEKERKIVLTTAKDHPISGFVCFLPYILHNLAILYLLHIGRYKKYLNYSQTTTCKSLVKINLCACLLKLLLLLLLEQGGICWCVCVYAFYLTAYKFIIVAKHKRDDIKTRKVNCKCNDTLF